MKATELHNLQQGIIVFLRNSLGLTPIVAGNTEINYIYRKNEAKPTDSNYIDIQFSTINTNRGLQCRNDDLILDFDVYGTNEIITQKLAYLLIDYIENVYVDETHVFINPSLSGGVVSLSKNHYVQRVIAKVVT